MQVVLAIMLAAALTVIYLNYQISFYLKNQKQLEIEQYVIDNKLHAEQYYAIFTWREVGNSNYYTEMSDTTDDYISLRTWCDSLYQYGSKDPTLRDIQYEIRSIECELCKKGL